MLCAADYAPRDPETAGLFDVEVTLIEWDGEEEDLLLVDLFLTDCDDHNALNGAVAHRLVDDGWGVDVGQARASIDDGDVIIRGVEYRGVTA